MIFNVKIAARLLRKIFASPNLTACPFARNAKARIPRKRFPKSLRLLHHLLPARVIQPAIAVAEHKAADIPEAANPNDRASFYFKQEIYITEFKNTGALWAQQQ
jgi:hypothetical protein